MTIIGFISAVLGLAALVGAAIAVLFSQLRKNTTQIVREENEDLRKRLVTVESAEEQCKDRLAKQEATTQVLSDMVTGASAVSDLAAVVTANHAEILKRLEAIDGRLARRRTT